MNREDILKGVYEDFFGTTGKPAVSAQQEFPMEEKIKDIDALNIDDNSKELLKKIIEYMKKYHEKIEKQFISFNMCIYSDNKETVKDVLNIIHSAINNFQYMPKGECKKLSFYDIESAEVLDEYYGANNNVIALENLEAFDKKEQSVKEKIIYKIENYISEKEEKVLNVLVVKNKEELSELFLMSEKIKNEFSDFQIIGTKPDVQDVYQEILEKLKESMEIDDEFQIALLDYISATYTNTNLSYPEYKSNLCEKLMFTKKVPEYEKDKGLDEIFEELNQLVGLDKVKTMLKELVNLIELKNKTKDDLKIKDINLHMIFLGNPGTGKTTVARIVAEILYNLKYIKQNKLVEVSSKDLVAEYVGQTAPKTMAVVQKALGGVLFIDEAYSLASGSGQGNSYNEEAIATLIQAMENNRDNLVVIFAGYTKEMQDFLNVNSGIVSRIGYTIEFEDYTSEELIQIFLQMMKKSGFTVSKEAIEKAKEVIEQYRGTKNFGNARFARNLYEKTIVKHAANTNGKKDKRALKTIKPEDISTENLLVMF